MTEIKTWHQRCMEHPDHQTGMVSDEMIRARMCEEIEELRAEIERLRARVEVLERVREAAQRAQECWGILFAIPLIDKPFDDLRAALEAKP